MFAGTPTTWPDPAPMSTLHILLLFGGVPLLVILVVFLLGYAPSWVKGPRYRPGQHWDARSEWIGGPEAAEAGGTSAQPDLDTGGASARW